MPINKTFSSRVTVLAWHFVRSDRRLRYGDGREVRAGDTYAAPGRLALVLGGLGMYGAERAIDALRAAPGPVVCRVQMTGEIQRGRQAVVARRRRVLAMADASAALHVYALGIAARALHSAACDSAVLWEAIDAKRAWLADPSCGARLDAAWGAAWAYAATLPEGPLKHVARAAARQTACEPLAAGMEAAIAVVGSHVARGMNPQAAWHLVNEPLAAALESLLLAAPPSAARDSAPSLPARTLHAAT